MRVEAEVMVTISSFVLGLASRLETAREKEEREERKSAVRLTHGKDGSLSESLL